MVLLRRRHAGEHVGHQRAARGVGRDVEVLRRVLALQVDVGSAVEWGDLNSLSKKAILAR